MPRNFSTAEPVFVTMTLGSTTIKYGFKCRLQRDTAYATLGITRIDPASITAAIVQGLVIGANAPKPARASKLFDTNPPGYEGTFVSDAQIAAAKADGWRIKPRTPTRSPSESSRSMTTYVTINGIKYAWQYTKPLASVTGIDLNAIGVQKATATDKDLVWGCSFPKPPRIGKIIQDPDDPAGDKFTTFYDPSRTPPATDGWFGVNAKGANLLTADDLKSII